MKRHLIIIYTVIIILVISGRYAWLHCQWDWVSRISALAVIIGILIEHWGIIIGKPAPAAQSSLNSERLAILMLCLGTFLAGFGEMFGKLAFGCSGG